MSVLAIIPARVGSKGIPNKNFTVLAGTTPVERALSVAARVWQCAQVVLTSDLGPGFRVGEFGYIERPAALAQDDTPMIDVVKHVLQAIPGPDDQIIVLLQPTQPLREPKHVTAAIELLRASGADSVVSVIEVPQATHPELLCETDQAGALLPWRWWCECGSERWEDMPKSRQDVSRPAYYRDGTVYAFCRRNCNPVAGIVRDYRPFPLGANLFAEGSLVRKMRPAAHFYGETCVPLIIPAEESCPLDTPEDWAEAERRLRVEKA